MSLSFREPPPLGGGRVVQTPSIVWLCNSLATADKLAAWAKETYPESEAKKTFLFASGIWLVVIVDLSGVDKDVVKADNS